MSLDANRLQTVFTNVFAIDFFKTNAAVVGIVRQQLILRQLDVTLLDLAALHAFF